MYAEPNHPFPDKKPPNDLVQTQTKQIFPDRRIPRAQRKNNRKVVQTFYAKAQSDLEKKQTFKTRLLLR